METWFVSCGELAIRICVCDFDIVGRYHRCRTLEKRLEAVFARWRLGGGVGFFGAGVYVAGDECVFHDYSSDLGREGGVAEDGGWGGHDC